MPVTPAQRDAAIAALIVHREAGRLDSSQFEDRQVLADSAQTWSELDRLFVDLPEPHPRRPQPQPAPAASVPPASPDGPADLLAEWGPRLMAATPIIATILFFTVFRTWVVFLLIPLVGALVGGSRKNRR